MPERTDVESIEFKPADGGLVSESRGRTHPMGKNGPVDYHHKTAIHPSLSHAMRHMKSALGHHFGKKEKMAKEDKSKGMKKG